MRQRFGDDLKVAVIGLGYVGLPLACSLSRVHEVVGFDISEEKVGFLERGIDPTGEVGSEGLKGVELEFTTDRERLKGIQVYIIAVPTPINRNKLPDLGPLEGASRTVGRVLGKGSVVVYESTVYPGVTEEFCGRILEEESGLEMGSDFHVGYSPERINPGDSLHSLERIVKVVSAQDERTALLLKDLYGSVVKAGIHVAPSIKVAEAAKVIENAQRDINIAFMNELSLIFNLMGIDTRDVLEAASTKWNFLPFTPGLVGGHCIGVDPYYLTYKAQELGYHPQVILAGRRINDMMGRYVAQQAVKLLIRSGKNVNGSRVNVLGVTFKENVPDVRNSRVLDMVTELLDFGVDVSIADPLADEEDVRSEYGFGLTRFEDLPKADAVILAVPHNEYMKLGLEGVARMFRNRNGVFLDVRSIFRKEDARGMNMVYWSL